MNTRILAATAICAVAGLSLGNSTLAQGTAQPVKGQRIEAWIPVDPSAASGIQPAGHQHLRSAPGPYGYAGYGYGSQPYGMAPPYVHQSGPPDHGHPGRLFDGGWYGWKGSPHGTPGYPKHHFHREYVGPQGPPTAAVAYPYYTIRGPRDFLLDNPPSIGR
jgi:hypothetical protein